jgi:hypothetical protein
VGHGFSSNQHIVQKPVSEMYTSHFEHAWSSTFQQQQKPTVYQIIKTTTIHITYLFNTEQTA